MGRAYLVAAAAVLATGLLIVRLRRAPAAPPPVPVATLDAAAPRRAPGRARRGGMDLTFLVTADTHAGYAGKIALPDHPGGVGVEDVHQVVIATMNDIAGTPFPAGLGGVVGKPRGVLIAGDLTENGQAAQWARFEAMYGLTGAEGWLRHPVYEGVGNHDVWGGPYVKAQVAKRHGAARYAWDWDDLHVVCLGEGPDTADIAWLRDDLAATGPDVGVVLFFHYPLTGPSPGDTWFAAGPFRDELARALLGYRVLGIFSGHLHTSGRYTWRGHHAYLEGSVKHSWHSFSVVHVTDTRWTVASYNYDRHAFWWWHEKPVFGGKGEERSWFSEGDPLVGRPAGR
jgi:cytolysin (calcineurin-like family phosphatase)